MLLKNKKIFFNQKGQAVFEMILFLPFLMFLYTIYYTTGNSINGSINQQKAVRGYFYTLVKGNSYVIPFVELKHFRSLGISKVGFFSLGWDDHLTNDKPFAPCFRFSSILKNKTTEECNSGEREAPDSSRFIRVFTYYGVCGPYYTPSSVDRDSYSIDQPNQALTASCTLGN